MVGGKSRIVSGGNWVHLDTVLTEEGRLEALSYVVAASPPK